MVVTDKHPDIAILRTLGASPASIMKIFMVQGTLIGVIGTALACSWHRPVAQHRRGGAGDRARLQLPDLSREVYYISELPSQLNWTDVWTVAGVALALAFLATLYPSWRAARVNPAEALRYE